MSEDSKIENKLLKNYFTAWLGGFTSSILIITTYIHFRLQEICQAYRDTAGPLGHQTSLECANPPETLAIVLLNPIYLLIAVFAGITIVIAYRIYREVKNNG